MSFIERIKKWLNKKTYFSVRDAESFEEKDCRLFSNADFFNISIIFFIISFALGIFCSTIYFRCYLDTSYQEEKNKLLIKELYKDLDKIKKNNKQRNNFLISLQNLMNNKDDFAAESNVRNYSAKYFCFPVKNAEVNSNFENDTLKPKIKKEDKILAVAEGLIIFESLKKDTCCLILQDKNGFVIVYNFVGKIFKNIGASVNVGEIIAMATKNSEMTLEVFLAAQKISFENLFIN
ncbi:MAG: M23 family metallopeptidase [Cytophagales bacterium]|jgi:hypothetical protein|nr:M23 family metallopeptidase [Cytophagales bacterium]